MITDNISRYRFEYEEAVNVLIEYNKTSKSTGIVFPIIFLYRHYIELTLKQIIMKNREFLEMPEQFPNGHNINKLWRKCRDYLEKTDKLIDPDYCKSKDYNETIIKAYDSLEADLDKFAAIDPNSEHFRYPVDTQGTPLVIDKKLLGKLLRELPSLVVRISYNLDGIVAGIHQIVQDKHDSSHRDYD
jgi:hypothetical protein